MNEFKKRLLSCLLCATGGLNLNAKALNSTPEQKRSETSVAGRSDGGSREGSLFSFRSLAEALFLGYFSYDKCQNYKKNKKFGDMNTELNDAKNQLTDKEAELVKKGNDLQEAKKNLELEIIEFNKKQQNFTNQEKQLKLDQQKFTEKSKKTVLGAQALYTLFSNILDKQIGNAGYFSEWKNFDEEKQKLEFADFGGFTYGIKGYLQLEEENVEKFKKAEEFGGWIDELDVRYLKNAEVFDRKSKYFYPDVLPGNFYGNHDGAREIFTKYIGMASQKPYCIICTFYYAKSSEYKYQSNLDKIFCVFAIGKVVDKK